MSLQQLRREISDLRKTIIPDILGEKITVTPEILRCFKEFKTAQERAKQRLLDNGTPPEELKEHERMRFISDPEVMKTSHNLLRAKWNANNKDEPQIKINYLFSCSAEVEN